MSNPIVFFGSGPVAAKSLELLAEYSTVEAVITKPRAAHHKGDVPVLVLAEKLAIPTLTANNKAELDTLIEKKTFASNLAVLVDFGIIVSQDVIGAFPLGIVNSHFSLLPEWRGADPITFSILSGQQQTGVSLMLLVPAMDEGPLLSQAIVDIGTTTTPQLTDTLIQTSDAMLQTILPLYMAGQVDPAPQTVATLAKSHVPTYSRKLTKEDGILDWRKPADQLEREIRAFLSWPKSRTTIHDVDIVITKARAERLQGKPGAINVHEKQPIIFCSKDALVIESVIPAGKKEMSGQAFLAGYKARIFES